MYGGHEVRDVNAVYHDVDGTFVVCPKCAPHVRARNIADAMRAIGLDPEEM
jgi:hypothetical protein